MINNILSAIWLAMYVGFVIWANSQIKEIMNIKNTIKRCADQEFTRIFCAQLRQDIPLYDLKTGQWCYLASHSEDKQTITIWTIHPDNKNEDKISFDVSRADLIFPPNSPWN